MQIRVQSHILKVLVYGKSSTQEVVALFDLCQCDFLILNRMGVFPSLRRQKRFIYTVVHAEQQAHSFKSTALFAREVSH